MDIDPTAGRQGWINHAINRETTASLNLADQMRRQLLASRLGKLITITPLALIGVAITATISTIIKRSRGKRR